MGFLHVGDLAITFNPLKAQVVIGQEDFRSIENYNPMNDISLSRPGGVFIDRSASPQLMYVTDGHNNRILVYEWTGAPITHAVRILGQDIAHGSTSNGDSTFIDFPNYPNPTANTLAFVPTDSLSPIESAAGSGMDVDSNGSLYVCDFRNHRVLRYPRGSATPDFVWGQDDFVHGSMNKGNGLVCSATSLYFSENIDDNDNVFAADVACDPVLGGFWVTDSGNHRVLHFPSNSKTADVVLGQASFTTRTTGTGLNKFYGPNAVCVSPSTGHLYVCDMDNSRVLKFAGPTTGITSGASGVSFGTWLSPTTIDFDPMEPNRLWISETRSSNVFIYLVEESTGAAVPNRALGTGDGNAISNPQGSLGFDTSGNVFVTSQTAANSNMVLEFVRGGSRTTPVTILHGATGVSTGFRDIHAIAVSDTQLIVADAGRILFWNGLSSITTGKAATGYLAGMSTNSITGFDSTDTALEDIVSMCVDGNNEHLWVTTRAFAATSAGMVCYSLPLVSGQTPFLRLGQVVGTPSINCLDGTTTDPFSNWGVYANADSSEIWLTQKESNRALRIRNPLTNPLIDVILGQTTSSDVTANRGGAKSSTTLSAPGGIRMNEDGYLFVSDHSLETSGNWRLMIYEPDDITSGNSSMIFAPAAIKIFDPLTPWQPAFEPGTGRMVVGYSGYNAAPVIGGYLGRFPGYYNDPLTVGNYTADGYLQDFYSMAVAAVFDFGGNLYVADHNRRLVRIYFTPFGGGVRFSYVSVYAPDTVSEGFGAPIKITVTDPNGGTPTGWVTVSGAATEGGTARFTMEKELQQGAVDMYLQFEAEDAIPLDVAIGNVPVFYFTVEYAGSPRHMPSSTTFTIRLREYGRGG